MITKSIYIDNYQIQLIIANKYGKLAVLAGRTRVLSLRPNEIVYEVGGTTECLFVVVEGRIQLDRQKGSLTLVDRICEPGIYFGAEGFLRKPLSKRVHRAWVGSHETTVLEVAKG